MNVNKLEISKKVSISIAANASQVVEPILEIVCLRSSLKNRSNYSVKLCDLGNQRDSSVLVRIEKRISAVTDICQMSQQNDLVVFRPHIEDLLVVCTTEKNLR